MGTAKLSLRLTHACSSRRARTVVRSTRRPSCWCSDSGSRFRDIGFELPLSRRYALCKRCGPLENGENRIYVRRTAFTARPFDSTRRVLRPAPSACSLYSSKGPGASVTSGSLGGYGVDTERLVPLKGNQALGAFGRRRE